MYQLHHTWIYPFHQPCLSTPALMHGAVSAWIIFASTCMCKHFFTIFTPLPVSLIPSHSNWCHAHPGNGLFCTPVLQFCRRQKRKDMKKNVTFLLIFYSFIHICIHCLGHFSPIPPPSSSPLLSPLLPVRTCSALIS
jgi:hypothetical protein